jgi:hypothetical protein
MKEVHKLEPITLCFRALQYPFLDGDRAAIHTVPNQELQIDSRLIYP